MTHRIRHVRVLAQVFIAACVGLAAGCHKTPDTSEIFRPWGCHNEAELRERLGQNKNLLAVRVTESRWEDRGPDVEAHLHYQATVFKSYKGDWSVGERLGFVRSFDYSVPTNVPLTNYPNNLAFIMTDEHTTTEIILDTGDFESLNSELEPALRILFSK